MGINKECSSLSLLKEARERGIYPYQDDITFIAYKLLLERGAYVNQFIFPTTPVGESLLRTLYTATHTREQMNHALQQIIEVY
ncbi:MAG: hypothetical protein GX661_04750 [Acholeplasmataceae bacterium]|nr:hypothetical protein [Acholeplasmataceae bacterium]